MPHEHYGDSDSHKLDDWEGVPDFGPLDEVDMRPEPEPVSDNTSGPFSTTHDWLAVPDFGAPSSASSLDGITEDREGQFDTDSGRFHDPNTGRFEPGSPPPDLAPTARRYRGADGRFKSRSSDLFDEEPEVRLDSLEPRG